MTLSRRPIDRLLELLTKDPPQNIGPIVWGNVIRFLDIKARSLDLRITSERKIAGVPPHILGDWYREYCDTRGGNGEIAFSRRHRQHICKAFEEIRREWMRFVAEPLLEVKNYSRSARKGFIDFRGMRDFSKGDLERMRLVIARSISEFGTFPSLSKTDEIKPALPDQALAIKFYYLVFGLIVNTGIAFPGCFSNLCRLQRKHIYSLDEGEFNHSAEFLRAALDQRNGG